MTWKSSSQQPSMIYLISPPHPEGNWKLEFFDYTYKYNVLAIIYLDI